MIGFQALVAAMTLQSVESLSGDEAPTGVTPKQVSPEKPKKKPKAKATPKGVPKAKVEKSTKTPVLKRPAASSATTESQTPQKQSKKRPAGSVSSPKALKVYKYYYKDLQKWGFKINGSEKFSVTRTHFHILSFSCWFLDSENMIVIPLLESHRLLSSRKSTVSARRRATKLRSPGENCCKSVVIYLVPNMIL